MGRSTITTMFLALAKVLSSGLRHLLHNPIAPALSNGESYSVRSSTITIEPLIALSFPPLEISPSQGLFFIRQGSSVLKRAYSTKPHAFLQYFIPKFKLGKIILGSLHGGKLFFILYFFRMEFLQDTSDPFRQTNKYDNEIFYLMYYNQLYQSKLFKQLAIILGIYDCASIFL
jgi:hypothetical protein